jgi:HemK-like putative methylase
MKVKDWLKYAEGALDKAGIGSAHLDSLILLEDEFKKDRSWLLANQDTEISTGSGALGITAALELHIRNVDLYDIDASALSVARHNQALHELHLHTRKTDLLRHYLRPYDVILANLPYIPDHYQINQAAAMEPKIAIFGGKDGLEIYRRFFAQLHRFHWKPEYILCESLPPQHKDLDEIAQKYGFKLYKSDGFIQVFQPTIY